LNLGEHDITLLALSFLEKLKSPICDERPLYVEYVRKLGGEFSGNGWRSANISHLQESSAIIKPKASFDINSVEGLMHSEFYCVKTTEI
ncbi:MAG: hypothetical protein HRT44_12430, partial [Bdellovibrionales bacterium]|nr:hypothetical protein [Bdellovibrionales bacterium]NQZ20045.1 hypothetical protein [Bdellovibrionales bacterium]